MQRVDSFCILYTMAYQDIAPFPKRLTIMVGLLVVAAMAFGLALSYYKNILFDKQLASMQHKNDKLKQQIEAGYGTLAYYQSARYKDKYAKENLGLVNPGEKILILVKKPEAVLPSEVATLTPSQKEAMYEEHIRGIPVIEHWNIYLFHRSAIEALKMGS